MEIRLQDNNTFTDTECFICGGTFGLGAVAAVAYGPAEVPDTDDAMAAYAWLGPVVLGDVCEECVSAGLEQIGVRLGNRAEELRATAGYLERLADGPIDGPTMAE